MRISDKELLRRIKVSIKHNEDVTANEVFRILNKERFKFSELNNKLQLKVAREYRKDYNETVKDKIDLKTAFSCCRDTNDDIFYNLNGEVIND